MPHIVQKILKSAVMVDETAIDHCKVVKTTRIVARAVVYSTTMELEHNSNNRRHFSVLAAILY